MTIEELRTIFTEGNIVFFSGEDLPYTVAATSERYAIATRKLHRRHDADMIKHSVSMGAYRNFTEAYNDLKLCAVYTIVDMHEQVRGADNLVFGVYDYSLKEDCELAIKDLFSGAMGISHRNSTPLEIK